MPRGRIVPSVMSLRFAVFTTIALLCLPSLAAARRHDATPSTGLAAIRFAQPPPDFTFAGDAGPERLASLVGKPVVINFWASWCEPCQAEVGAFAELGRTYGDAVSLVTISEDEVPGAAQAFLRSHDVRAIAVDDPERAIFARYTVVPIPTTLVLAPDGSVSHVSVGALDWDELHAAVERVRPGRLTLPDGFGTVSGNAGTPQP